jgi:2-polyprenyl-3-methyl-5-hydroxy-6-metoxy-1,4-benzoquinol methylase
MHVILEEGEIASNRENYTTHYYDSEKPTYISENEADLEWWNFTYKSRIKMAQKLSDHNIEKWLDIGTGPGLFLESAELLGMQARGIEPSIQASNYAISRGLNVINDFFNHDNSQKIGKFDAIHTSAVLEHIADPGNFLANVLNCLSQDGVLVVVVPNDNNPIQEIFTSNTSKQKWWIAPPFHLNYFTHETLQKVLQNSGFEVIESTSSFPIDFFLLMGDDYIGNDKVGKEAHQRRKNFEKHFENAGELPLLECIYSKLSELGIGREIVIFARPARVRA